MLIGSITNQGSLQGEMNNANGYLTGVIKSAGQLGGQVVGLRGLKGDKGDTGATGQDGHSPVVTASKVDDTTTVYVDGSAIATINDGIDGQDGSDGQDGHSPVVTASKVGKVTTVSVDGSAIATINDGNDGQTGSDGQDGADGYSPSASVSKSGTTATITITDKNGTTTASVSDGSGVPTGGTSGQVLTKHSATDYDVSWEDPSGGTITDVTVDGTSIVNDGVAELETATQLRNGLMTALDKQKLDGIASGAEVNVQSDWNEADSTADDYIKNKPTIPTKTSDLNNDSGFITGYTETDPVFTASDAYGITSSDIDNWDGKQDELVSGTNIKTINNQSLLGSGDISVAAGGTPIPTAREVAEFDSSAHINSTDMTSQEVEDFVDELDVSGGGGIAEILADLTYDSGVNTVYGDYCKCRRKGHVVHVWGESSNGWSITQGAYRALTTLPSEFRPAQNVRFVCGALGGTQAITGYVSTDGIVYLYTSATTAYWNFTVTYLV